MTLHDHWLVCPMNVMWKNRSRACDGQECITCTLRSGRPPQWWRSGALLSRAVESIDRFIAPSRFCADKHAEYGFAPSIDVVPYFVPPVDPSAGMERPHQRPYFLFVGRLEDYKGLQEILPQLAGDGEFDLVVVGSGPFEARLRAQAKSMPRVHFSGWVNPAALGAYYKNALALIVPSITYETFGLVQVEAFAHSIPAIVNNLGPLPDINRQAGCDLVYSNQSELSKHLDSVWRDQARRQQLGTAANQAYSHYWTPAAHLAAYEKLIRSVKC